MGGEDAGFVAILEGPEHKALQSVDGANVGVGVEDDVA